RGQKRTFWALSSLLYSRKRTFGGVSGMSAMGQKRTLIDRRQWPVSAISDVSLSHLGFSTSPSGEGLADSKDAKPSARGSRLFDSREGLRFHLCERDSGSCICIMTVTWQDFEAIEVQTADTSIFLRRFGSELGVLLLHDFPQTHLMWRDVAPLLAQQFTVICADLRGYGRSGCPPSKSEHRPWHANSTPERAAVLQPLVRSGQA